MGSSRARSDSSGGRRGVSAAAAAAAFLPAGVMVVVFAALCGAFRSMAAAAVAAGGVPDSGAEGSLARLRCCARRRAADSATCRFVPSMSGFTPRCTASAILGGGPRAEGCEDTSAMIASSTPSWRILRWVCADAASLLSELWRARSALSTDPASMRDAKKKKRRKEGGKRSGPNGSVTETAAMGPREREKKDPLYVLVSTA